MFVVNFHATSGTNLMFFVLLPLVNSLHNITSPVNVFQRCFSQEDFIH